MSRSSIVLTESRFAPGKTNSLLSRVWELTFALSFLYIFFIQNVFFSVNGMIIALCGFSTLCMVLHFMLNKNGVIRINDMFGIAGFVFISFAASFVFSNNLSDSIDVGLRMVEYLVFGCSLYTFMSSNPWRFFAIIRYIWFSLTLLCVFVLIDGAEVTGAGAIGLETLNVNLLSSYISIQIMLSFLLIGNTKKKLSWFMYCVSIFVAVFVQILAASRRGFIVACVFILLSLFFCLIPRYTSKRSGKRIITLLILTLGLFVALFFVGEFILNETVLGQRFLGNFNSGDESRELYRGIALEQFQNSPVFGVGLNGLESVMGAYSHSLYYETLACTGVIGVLVLFISVIKIGVSLYRQIKLLKKRNINDTYITKLCFLFLGALLLAGIAVTTIYDFYFYICIAVLSAVIAVNRRRSI